ncbi:hypothetical protein EIP91_000104 [Steccherinum ochraceum]|uniref:Major facilitator superfamily (MFS) profile domain-containing protein n=1 Tax=Steccherinum ochraceum TaxID=92696 RepID=A0A4R0RX79_9APHY|nr:hypothetical protein EIP91_000104 [Steccherinum ochraceum]
MLLLTYFITSQYYMTSTTDETSPLQPESSETHAYDSFSQSVRQLEGAQRDSGNEGSPPLDVEKEYRLVKKLDRRIMPITCLLLLFAYLDRTSLGNARLQGLPEDILGGDPSGELFGWLNSVFFVPYLLCQVPASILSKAAGSDFSSVMIARIFLGVFEAGFTPGIPLYMTFWYTQHEIGVRLAYWVGFSAVAGAFGGVIAFVIQHVYAGIASWRLLFIVEGVPSVLLGFAAILLLPDRPEETHFLNEDERETQRQRRLRGSKPEESRTVNISHVVSAFTDWKVYIVGVIYFCANVALVSMSAFLPTIIKTFGYTDAPAQLLTVPPYAVCAVVLVLACRASGYLLLLNVPDHSHVRYFATFCIVGGTYTIVGVVIAWFSHNLGSETKKAVGIPIYMAIGQCGSILGSHLFPVTESPYYTRGFTISCSLQLLAAICAVILTVYYRTENRRRDRKYGAPTYGTLIETAELADEAPMFRYVP